MAGICFYECIQKIRDLINKPRKSFHLLKDPRFWNQMCSSLDVIGDSDLALSAYLETEFPREDGAKYLFVYGALQALLIQQDAAMHLRESLKVSNPTGLVLADPILEQIREVRHESIGHPTKKNKKKGKSVPATYHSISRATISKKGFQLLSSFGDGRTEFKDVLIEKMITSQRDKLRRVLDDIIDKLVREEIEHKERFRMDKLQAVFSQANYLTGKMCEGSRKNGEGWRWRRRADLKEIKNILGGFKSRLEERGLSIDTYVGIKCIYELLEYPIIELSIYSKLLEKGQEANINSQTAYIFSSFVREQIGELEVIAKEIDEEYSNSRAGD